MESWNCKCGNNLSTNSYKESAVNDTYVLIYQCKNCDKKGFTVTKNTKSVKGANVLKIFDKEVHSQEEIQEAIDSLSE